MYGLSSGAIHAKILLSRPQMPEGDTGEDVKVSQSYNNRLEKGSHEPDRSKVSGRYCCYFPLLRRETSSGDRYGFCSRVHQTHLLSRAEYRQFDFWIGDWDAFDPTNPTTKVARTRVDLILDGCVLHEDYEDADGHKVQSFSIYDASRRIWHQSWVTNRGEMLEIEGGLQAGEMVLSGVDHTADGKERHVRGSWKPVNGGVRETAVTSTDGGRTWKPWFDLLFRSHK